MLRNKGGYCELVNEISEMLRNKGGLLQGGLLRELELMYAAPER